MVPEKKIAGKNIAGVGLPMQRALLWGMWLLLAALAAWRVILAASVVLNPSLAGMEGMAVVQWPRLEGFAAWVAIALLILSRGLLPASVRQGRAAIVLAIVALVGMFFFGCSVALDPWTGAEGFNAAAGVVAVLLLAMCAAAIALLEVRAILQAMQRGGATILDVWRFAAAQWGLLMAAALVYMTMAVKKDRLLVEDQFRTLAFMLPAAGVLPNAMMAAGILWWDRIVRAGGSVLPVPRVRAWMVAFLLMNLGGLLLVWRASWMGIPGAGLEILGIIFYLIGFPREFWRGVGGKAVLAAWGLMAVAVGAMMMERVLLVWNPVISVFYSGAWRHLWMGAVVVWLMGMGAVAVGQLMPSLRMRRIALVAIVLMVSGVVGTAGIWLVTTTRAGEAQVPMMEWMIVGTGLELMGILAAAMGVIFGTNGAK